MQKPFRLTSSDTFLEVRKAGRSWHSRLLVLRVLCNNSQKTRIGVVVGRRIGNAVKRNQVKRRLREIAKAADLKVGRDVVLSAQPGSETVSFEVLKQAADALFRKASLINK